MAEQQQEPPAAPARSGEWLEVVATLLLALAAVATAWASYQASRWNGEQALAASRTNALRIEAARAASLYEAQAGVDVATFIQWVDARANDRPELQEFYEQRFRPEFAETFAAWLATDPFTDADAPATPFAMEEYRPAAEADSERLDREAAAAAGVVSRNVQRATDYVLAVVLFAVALFFAGMSTRLSSPRLRAVMLAVGCVVFVTAGIWIATFPVSFAV